MPIKKEINQPFIVINGDILTKFNMKQLIDFHKINKSKLTICASEYDVKIPFGVIETNGIELKKIIEKPTYKNHINAGIYCFDNELICWFCK